MAKVQNDFRNSLDEIYRNILLNNLPQIIKYFKSLGTHNPEKLQKINNKIAQIKQQQCNLKQKMADITQMYRQFVFEGENSDINPLRGDNGLVGYYTETYNAMLTQERQLGQQLQEIYSDPLWKNQQIVALLMQLFQKQAKVKEVQESINWRSSQEYQSISRYERDNELEEDYDDLLCRCRKDLEQTCKICLNYPEIIVYINAIIADNNRKNMRNARIPRRTY